MEIAAEVGQIFQTAKQTATEVAGQFYWPWHRGPDRVVVNTGGHLYEKYLSLRSQLLSARVIDPREEDAEGTSPYSISLLVLGKIHKQYFLFYKKYFEIRIAEFIVFISYFLR